MKEFGELIGKIVTVYPDEYESFKRKLCILKLKILIFTKRMKY